MKRSKIEPPFYADMRNDQSPTGLSDMIASFGEAQVFNDFDRTLRLEGGSAEDRAAARTWIKTFFPTAVVTNWDKKP